MDHDIGPKRKPRAVDRFEGYVRNHIKPRLGTRKAPGNAPDTFRTATIALLVSVVVIRFAGDTTRWR